MTLPLQTCVDVRVSPDGAVSRRGFLRVAGGATVAGLGITDRLAARAGELKKKDRAVILLWMAGGPSQFETLDPKPGAPTQGPTGAIATAVPGIRIAEHWGRGASVTPEMTIIRPMTSKEGNHGRADHPLHPGYPTVGASVQPGHA